LNKRYKDIFTFSSYESMHLSIIEKEIKHHLNQEFNESNDRLQELPVCKR